MKLTLGLLIVATQAAGVLSAARGPHPLGPANQNQNVRARADAEACWYESGFGCSDGYCWTACGDNGEWCWTAGNGGSGDWLTCDAFMDCISGECATGDCNACGCSC